MRYTAWIVLGPGRLYGCAFADISDTGARLAVENADIIPDTFTLWLSSNGSAQRKCNVVWRSAQQAGVAFELDALAPEKIPLVPDVAVETIEPNEMAVIDSSKMPA